MVAAAEQAAPAWVPIVAFAIPALIVLAVLIPALRKRRRYKSARRAERGRRAADGTQLGSALGIDDPSGYSSEALLKALAIQPEDHGPKDGLPHNEGWAGTMLGLKAKMSSASEVLEPHVFWGTRDRGQVFVRIGPDEKLEGGTTMLSNRHIRTITVLRVASPAFQIEADGGGSLRASDDSPAAVRALADSLAADEVTWSDTRVTGGEKGIVAARQAIDGLNYGFAYDLWLCERIARTLELEPLKPARIGPAWKVPYGLGKSLTPTAP